MKIKFCLLFKTINYFAEDLFDFRSYDIFNLLWALKLIDLKVFRGFVCIFVQKYW